MRCLQVQNHYHALEAPDSLEIIHDNCTLKTCQSQASSWGFSCGTCDEQLIVSGIHIFLYNVAWAFGAAGFFCQGVMCFAFRDAVLHIAAVYLLTTYSKF